MSTSRRLPLAGMICLSLVAAPAAAAEPPVESPAKPAKATKPGTAQPGRQPIDTIVVKGARYLPPYQARDSRTATKTDTALIDLPQSITVVTDKFAADQGATGLIELTRYMPGIGLAQGEGNRDTPVLRGNSTTADFYVDGIRDDVQYIRDVYNLERAEALKGPNAMIFGRGGTGGVINRVTRHADGDAHRSGTLQFGSGDRRRATFDLGAPFGTGHGFRVNAMREDSKGFREGAWIKRYGVNPTLGLRLGERTQLHLGLERFDDERVADRGVPSFRGRPIATDPATFFGDAERSRVEARADAFDADLEHAFDSGLRLRNHLRVADYDKLYRNVFPGAVDASGRNVTLSAYGNTTARRNLFNQTDLVWHAGSARLAHTLLAGAEFGRQITDNRRVTGYFGAPGSSATSIRVPVAFPRNPLPVDFRPSATDADNHGVARVAALYLQDQVTLSPRWQAIVGLRYDDFRVELRNNRNGGMLRSQDRLWSPRAGLVFKPRDTLAFYANYSVAHQPRAGEQLASLSASNAALAPESFRNVELGAKWDIRPDLAATLAVYRLDRGNVAIADPADPTRSILVDGQRANGVELGLAGRLTERWQVMGGYAWQAGEITTTQSATALAGNRLAQLPRHSASLWNRYDFSDRVGAGFGIIHRGAIFASADNSVELPAFTRFDAALYWSVLPEVEVQFNIENLGNKRYFASAHGNNNLMPGAPRSAWMTLNFKF